MHEKDALREAAPRRGDKTSGVHRLLGRVREAGTGCGEARDDTVWATRRPFAHGHKWPETPCATRAAHPVGQASHASQCVAVRGQLHNWRIGRAAGRGKVCLARGNYVT